MNNRRLDRASDCYIPLYIADIKVWRSNLRNCFIVVRPDAVHSDRTVQYDFITLPWRFSWRLWPRMLQWLTDKLHQGNYPKKISVSDKLHQENYPKKISVSENETTRPTSMWQHLEKCPIGILPIKKRNLPRSHLQNIHSSSPRIQYNSLVALSCRPNNCTRWRSTPFHQTAGRIWQSVVWWVAHKIKPPIPRTQTANVRSDCLLQHCYTALCVNEFFFLSHNPYLPWPPLRLSIPFSKTNTDKHFFSNRVVIPWNSLPADLSLSHVQNPSKTN